MAYQSLYRRYRPQRFAEVLGQEHVTAALRNAVRDGRVGHAYLFSGPRGTGKTSTARILAKALNCAEPDDGEPCGTCDSCRAITAGASLDVFELDAASNNSVDDIRRLIESAALGSPGRTKLYILDEVHQLSKAAANALLKTLEEPPSHVVFVLATTEPHKVLPTIRSRTQHFEFHLLGPEVLTAHARAVATDAGLDVDDDAVAAAVRRGAGSARDTLSALEAIAAGGRSADHVPGFTDLLDRLADRDPPGVLTALASAVSAGREPRELAEELVRWLRNAFLVGVAPGLVDAPPQDRELLTSVAERLGSDALVRSLELLGEALVDLRQAPDPRIPLEVALIRICRPGTDESLDRLGGHAGPPERVAGRPSAGSGPRTGGDRSPVEPGGAPAGGDPPRRPDRPASRPPRPGRPRPDSQASPPPDRPAGDRPRRPAVRAGGDGPAEAETPGPVDGSPPASLTEVSAVWDSVLGAIDRPMARALFAAGRWVEGPDGPLLAVPNQVHADKCSRYLGEVEAALAGALGRPVRLRLTTGTGPARSASPPSAGAAPTDGNPPEEDPADIDPDELEDAGDPATALQVVEATFPGAVIEDDGPA